MMEPAVYMVKMTVFRGSRKNASNASHKDYRLHTPCGACFLRRLPAVVPLALPRTVVRLEGTVVCLRLGRPWSSGLDVTTSCVFVGQVSSPSTLLVPLA